MQTEGNTVVPFKKRHPKVAERKEQSDKILSQYPDKVPVICERADGSQLMQLDKSKFLIPSDFQGIQFNQLIRKRMKMDKNEALYLFVSGKKLLASDKQMSEIYKENMDTDGFLYIQYKEEMVYG